MTQPDFKAAKEAFEQARMLLLSDGRFSEEEVDAIGKALLIADKLMEIKPFIDAVDGWDDGETFYKSAVEKVRELFKEITQ